MEYYELRVTDDWIRVVHKSVSRYLETWPGGDPDEQIALTQVKENLDRLMLELSFSKTVNE
jgi:hypothetical protein